MHDALYLRNIYKYTYVYEKLYDMNVTYTQVPAVSIGVCLCVCPRRRRRSSCPLAHAEITDASLFIFTTRPREKNYAECRRPRHVHITRYRYKFCGIPTPRTVAPSSLPPTPLPFAYWWSITQPARRRIAATFRIENKR